MTRFPLAILSLALAAAAMTGSAAAEGLQAPLKFWEGRTESVGTVKLIMKKAFRTRSIGHGRIRADGSLDLVQRVEEDGKPAKERRWQIHKVGPGRYAGTMTEAKGPVTIDEIGGRYRFRFKMDGGVAVEQWLTPNPDGKSGTNKVVIKKFGMTVGRSEGTVRKLN